MMHLFLALVLLAGLCHVNAFSSYFGGGGDCTEHMDCGPDGYCDTMGYCYPLDFCFTYLDAIDGYCPGPPPDGGDNDCFAHEECPEYQFCGNDNMCWPENDCGEVNVPPPLGGFCPGDGGGDPPPDGECYSHGECQENQFCGNDFMCYPESDCGFEFAPPPLGGNCPGGGEPPDTGGSGSGGCNSHADCGPNYYCDTGNSCWAAMTCPDYQDAIDAICPPFDPNFDPYPSSSPWPSGSSAWWPGSDLVTCTEHADCADSDSYCAEGYGSYEPTCFPCCYCALFNDGVGGECPECAGGCESSISGPKQFTDEQASCTNNQFELKVTYSAFDDCWVEETEWKILNGAGDDIFTQNPWLYYAGASHDTRVCLNVNKDKAINSFSMMIRDAAGDGMCGCCSAKCDDTNFLRVTTPDGHEILPPFTSRGAPDAAGGNCPAGTQFGWETLKIDLVLDFTAEDGTYSEPIDFGVDIYFAEAAANLFQGQEYALPTEGTYTIVPDSIIYNETSGFLQFPADGTMTEFTFSATMSNRFGFEHTASMTVDNGVYSEKPDDTTTWQCDTTDVYSNADGSFPPVHCTLSGKKAGADVYTYWTDYEPDLVGPGTISFDRTNVDPYGPYSGEGVYPPMLVQDFLFTPSRKGGLTEISMNPSDGTTVTINAYSNPDVTSFVLCTESVGSPGDTISCTFSPRVDRATINLVNVGGLSTFQQDAVVDPSWDAAFSELTVRVDELTGTPVYDFTFQLGSEPGFYEAGIQLTTGQKVLTRIIAYGVPDMTSTIKCDYVDIVNGDDIRCRVNPKKNGQVIYAAPESISFQTSPADLGTCDNLEIDLATADYFCDFTPSGDRTGSILLMYMINNDGGSPGANTAREHTFNQLAQPTVTLAYNGIAYLADGPQTVEINTTEPVYTRLFQPSLTSGAFASVNVYAVEANAGTEGPIGYYTSFRFVVEPLASGVFVVDDGYALGGVASFEITVAPDATTSVECSDYAYPGDLVNCTITPKKEGEIVQSAAREFTPNTPFTSWELGNMTANDDGTFAYTLQTTPDASSLGSHRLTVALAIQGGLVSTQLPVVGIPKPKSGSYIECRNSQIVALTETRCTFRPHLDGKPIYAVGAESEITVTPADYVTVSPIETVVGQALVFEIVAQRPFEQLRLTESLTGATTTVSVVPSAFMYAWSQHDALTSSGDVVVSSVSSGRESDGSEVTADTLSFVDDADTQSNMVSMACSKLYCASVTSDGDLFTWGGKSSRSFYESHLGRSGGWQPARVTGYETLVFTKVFMLDVELTNEDSELYYSLGLVLDTNNDLYVWGSDNPSTVDFEDTSGLELFATWNADHTDYKNGFGFLVASRILDITQDGQIILIQIEDGVVLSITMNELYKDVLGRPDTSIDFDIPLPVDFADYGKVTPISMFCRDYCMLLDTNQRLFSWGSGLMHTLLPSAKRPELVPVGSKFGDEPLRAVYGGTSSVIVLTESGRVFRMYVLPNDPTFEFGDVLDDFEEVLGLGPSPIVQVSVGLSTVSFLTEAGAVFEVAQALDGTFNPISGQRQCTPTEFTCGVGTCVDGVRECDGVADCPDASDESNCVCTDIYLPYTPAMDVNERELWDGSNVVPNEDYTFGGYMHTHGVFQLDGYYNGRRMYRKESGNMVMWYDSFYNEGTGRWILSYDVHMYCDPDLFSSYYDWSDHWSSSSWPSSYSGAFSSSWPSSSSSPWGWSNSQDAGCNLRNGCCERGEETRVWPAPVSNPEAYFPEFKEDYFGHYVCYAPSSAQELVDVPAEDWICCHTDDSAAPLRNGGFCEFDYINEDGYQANSPALVGPSQTTFMNLECYNRPAAETYDECSSIQVRDSRFFNGFYYYVDYLNNIPYYFNGQSSMYLYYANGYWNFDFDLQANIYFDDGGTRFTNDFNASHVGDYMLSEELRVEFWDKQTYRIEPDVNFQASCSSLGEPCVMVTIEIDSNTNYGNEMFWELMPFIDEAYGGPLADNQIIGSPVCLREGVYGFKAMDTFGDGWGDATYTIKDEDMNVLVGPSSVNGYGRLNEFFEVIANVPPPPPPASMEGKLPYNWTSWQHGGCWDNSDPFLNNGADCWETASSGSYGTYVAKSFDAGDPFFPRTSIVYDYRIGGASVVHDEVYIQQTFTKGPGIQGNHMCMDYPNYVFDGYLTCENLMNMKQTLMGYTMVDFCDLVDMEDGVDDVFGCGGSYENSYYSDYDVINVWDACCFVNPDNPATTDAGVNGWHGGVQNIGAELWATDDPNCDTLAPSSVKCGNFPTQEGKHPLSCGFVDRSFLCVTGPEGVHVDYVAHKGLYDPINDPTLTLGYPAGDTDTWDMLEQAAYYVVNMYGGVWRYEPDVTWDGVWIRDGGRMKLGRKDGFWMLQSYNLNDGAFTTTCTHINTQRETNPLSLDPWGWQCGLQTMPFENFHCYDDWGWRTNITGCEYGWIMLDFQPTVDLEPSDYTGCAIEVSNSIAPELEGEYAFMGYFNNEPYFALTTGSVYLYWDGTWLFDADMDFKNLFLGLIGELVYLNGEDQPAELAGVASRDSLLNVVQNTPEKYVWLLWDRTLDDFVIDDVNYGPTIGCIEIDADTSVQHGRRLLHVETHEHEMVKMDTPKMQTYTAAHAKSGAAGAAATAPHRARKAAPLKTPVATDLVKKLNKLPPMTVDLSKQPRPVSIDSTTERRLSPRDRSHKAQRAKADREARFSHANEHLDTVIAPSAVLNDMPAATSRKLFTHLLDEPQSVDIGLGAQVKFIYTYAHSFVSLQAPQIHIDPASGVTPFDSCGAGAWPLLCPTLSLALARNQMVGTSFLLHEGTYSESDIRSSVDGITISSADNLNASQVIVDCGDGSCFDLSGTWLVLSDFTIQNGLSSSNGGVMTLEQGQEFLFKNMKFQNSQAEKGGAVAVLSDAQAVFHDCQFINNTATHGGGVFTDSWGIVTLKDGLFQGNRASRDGGAVSITAMISTLVEGTEFDGNSAGESGGGMFFSQAAAITFRDVTMHENSAEMGAGVSASNSFLEVFDGEFSSNMAEATAGAILLEFSGMYMNNTEVKNNVAESDLGGGVYCLGERDVTIAHSLFQANEAQTGGGLFTIFCKPMVTNSRFEANVAVHGGAISASNDGAVTITDSQFVANIAAEKGGGLHLAECEAVYVTSTTFDANDAYSGGGIFIIGSRAGLFGSDVHLQNNIARQGGGIFWSTLEPEGNYTFANNTAAQGSDLASVASKLEWQGVPDDFVATPAELFAPSISIVMKDVYDNVLVLDNETPFSLRADVISECSDLCSEFTFCDAADEDAVCGPTGMKGVVFGNVKRGTFNFTYDPDDPESSTAFGVAVFPDTTVEITATVAVFGLGDVVADPLLVDFRPCVSGEQIEADSCSTCSAGKFADGEMVTQCSDCLVGQYQDLEGQSFCHSCPNGTSAGTPGSRACTVCPDGTYANATGSEVCLSCPDFSVGHLNQSYCLCAGSVDYNENPPVDSGLGYYAVQDSSEPIGFRCDQCPEGADCRNDGTTIENVLPLGDYMAALDNENKVFYECMVDTCGEYGVCQNPCTAEMSQADCDLFHERGLTWEEGDNPAWQVLYTGPTCTECIDGAARTGYLQCAPCPNPTENALKLTGTLIAALVCSCVYVWKTIDGALKQDSRSDVMIQILLSLSQFNGIAASFDFSWPDIVMGLLQVHRGVGDFAGQIVSVDCFLEANSGLEAFYVKTIVIAMFPFMIVFASAGCSWLFGKFWLEARQGIPEAQWKESAKNLFVTACAVLFFLVHPTITQQTFNLFSCTHFSGEKEFADDYWQLQSDYSIRCYTAKHNLYCALLGVPMMIFWVFGIPAYEVYLVHQNRDKLKNREVALKYSFIYKPFKHKYYFWSAIIAARKIALLAIGAFFSANSHIQALLTVLLTGSAALLEFHYSPHSFVFTHRLELMSLAVSLFTFYGGLYMFVSDGVDPEGMERIRNAVAYLIVIIQVGLLLIAVYMFYEVYKHPATSFDSDVHEDDDKVKALEMDDLNDEEGKTGDEDEDDTQGNTSNQVKVHYADDDNTSPMDKYALPGAVDEDDDENLLRPTDHAGGRSSFSQHRFSTSDKAAMMMDDFKANSDAMRNAHDMEQNEQHDDLDRRIMEKQARLSTQKSPRNPAIDHD